MVVSNRLRRKIKDGLWALSLANLWLISVYYVPLASMGADYYYRKAPLTQTRFLAMTANLFWFAALVWVVIGVIRRSHHWWLRPVCEWLFLLLWVVPLDFCRQVVFGASLGQIVRILKPAGLAAGLLVLLVVLIWRRRWIIRAMVIATGILTPLAFLTLGRIALAIFTPMPPLTVPPAPALSPVRPGQPRVVWMIFDEADQRLMFEHRPGYLRMPEFDRLRSQCLFATNAYPPGPDTIESLPGLTTGRRVSKALPENSSDLRLTLADSGQVVRWSELPSVFESARALGVNTALVGWLHPYDRVLGRNLNYCCWYPYAFCDVVVDPSLLQAMRLQLDGILSGFHFRSLHAQLCRATLADSLCVVTNRTYGLVFLHLVPPHRPGVFDPATGRFTVLDLTRVKAYFNNLPLADLTLGKLRRAMESSGEWDRSWVIVSADHSWRESRAYDGVRDLRVPYLIKPPGACQSVAYSPEVNTMLTRDLVLAILRSEVTNQQQTIGWLEAHGGQKPATGSIAARR
jgi:hypothetical protein